MTLKQKIVKLAYPLIMKLGGKKQDVMSNEKPVVPPVCFYSLKASLINGQAFDFSALKGKKVLIVNVASNCGYTGQYDELESLYKEYSGTLMILGFPANDFKQQEPGSDDEIAAFCRMNYGVSFPLFQKNSVLRPQPQPVYRWLTDPTQNGWNEKEPVWNFCKYLINEEGQLLAFFPQTVSPLSNDITSLILSR